MAGLRLLDNDTPYDTYEIASLACYLRLGSTCKHVETSSSSLAPPEIESWCTAVARRSDADVAGMRVGSKTQQTYVAHHDCVPWQRR